MLAGQGWALGNFDEHVTVFSHFYKVIDHVLKRKTNQ